jgi:TonB-linked SusC/RagA family outer membrane protein
MTRFLSVFMVLMLSGVMALAQNRTITGKVVDEKGNGIPFASVKVSNTRGGTSTDTDGSFSVRADNSSSLIVSSNGYASQTVSVGDQTFIAIALKQTNGAMQEVVINTTLGRQISKASTTTTITSVKAKELTQGRSANLIQGLTGKVTGVNIQQTNSGVTQDTRITLRGLRSLTGDNQPMLILDGTPMSLNFLSSINQNDIAEVTILKSATSTAVYGPEGANGAIVVTTKRGSKAKPMISVSHSVQFESISYMAKTQNRWGAGYAQDPLTGQGTFAPEEQQSWGIEFDGVVRDLGEKGPNGEIQRQPYSYLVNERKKFFDVGITNQTDFSYSTGDFYFSGQNSSIKGTMPGDVLTRRTGTMRAEKEYNKFKAIFNLRYTNTKSNTTTANSAIYYGIVSAPGNVPITKYKNWQTDFFASPEGYYTPYLPNASPTPYFAKDNDRREGRKDDIFGNIEFNYKASKSLSFVYRGGVTISDDQSRSTRGAYQTSPYYTTRPNVGTAIVIAGQVSDASNYNSRLTSEFFAKHNKSVGKFGFNTLVGYSFRESRQKFLQAGSANLGQSPFLSIASRLGEPTVTSSNTLSRLQRLFGELEANFDRKIYVKLNANYDQDSRLAPPSGDFDRKRYSFFYPGISTSILLHEIIPGLKDNKVLSSAKIRAAYSVSGNTNLSAYQNDLRFGIPNFFPFGTVAGYQIGSTAYPAAGLTPEFVKTKEFGVELGFLKNRLTVEASYYDQNNTDQILQASLSNTTGATSTFLNAGAFNNKGFELDVAVNDLVKIGEVGFDFKVGYVKQSSKITKIIDGLDELGIGNFNFAIVGEPAFTFKVKDYQRDPASGKVIVDANTGMPSLANEDVRAGRTLPTDILNLNLNVNWKNISFSVVGQFSTGNKIIADELGEFMDDNGISARSGDHGRRAFVFPNSVYKDASGKFVENTSVFTKTYGRLFYNSTLNTDAVSNYVASGAFWKLREVALTYTFPASLFQKGVIKGITAGISGRNLFMWLPKSNQWTDPEFTSNGNSAFTGNATGRSTAFNMPPTRFMGMNVTVQF